MALFCTCKLMLVLPCVLQSLLQGAWEERCWASKPRHCIQTKDLLLKTVISRCPGLLFVFPHRKKICWANNWQMLFKLAESLKIHLRPGGGDFATALMGAASELIPLNASINKSSSICNTRTRLSRAPPARVNVNYSRLGALSAACSGFVGCLRRSQGAGAGQSSTGGSQSVSAFKDTGLFTMRACIGSRRVLS